MRLKALHQSRCSSHQISSFNVQRMLHYSRRAVSFLYQSSTSQQFTFVNDFIIVGGPSSEFFSSEKFVSASVLTRFLRISNHLLSLVNPMTNPEVNYPTYKNITKNSLLNVSITSSWLFFC